MFSFILKPKIDELVLELISLVHNSVTAVLPALVFVLVPALVRLLIPARIHAPVLHSFLSWFLLRCFSGSCSSSSLGPCSDPYYGSSCLLVFLLWSLLWIDHALDPWSCRCCTDPPGLWVLLWFLWSPVPAVVSATVLQCSLLQALL